MHLLCRLMHLKYEPEQRIYEAFYVQNSSRRIVAGIG
jgi:hypothetical protein